MQLFKKIFYAILLTISILFALFYTIYKSTDWVNNSLRDYLNVLVEKDAHLEFKNMRGFFLNEIELEDIKVQLKTGELIRSNFLRAKFSIFDLIAGQYTLSAVYFDSLYLDLDPSKIATETPKNPKKKKLDYFNLYDELNYDKFNIPNISIRYGKIVLDKKKKTEIKALRYDGSFIVGEKIDIACRNASGIFSSNGVERRLALKSYISGDESGIQINQTQIFLDESKLQGKGRLNFDRDNSFLLFIDRGYLAGKDLTFLSPFFEMKSDYYFSLEGNGNKNGLRSKIHMDSAKVEKLSFTDSDIESYLNFSKGNLNIFSSNLNLNGGTYQIKGSILGKENNVELRFSNLDLKALGLTELGTNLNGSAKLAQTELDFSGYSLEANQINLRSSKVDKYRIHAAALLFQNDGGNFEFLKNSSLSLAYASKFKVNGFLRSDSLNLYLNSEKASIDRLMADMGANTVKANVESEIHLFGSIKEPDLKAKLRSDSLEFFNGFKLFNAEISFDGSDIFKQIVGIGSIKSDSTRVINSDNFAFDLAFHIQNDSVSFEKITLLDGNNGLRFKGSIASRDSTVHFFFDQFDARYNDYRIRNVNALSILKKGTVFTIEKTDFITPQGGSFSIGGLYLTNGVSTLRADLEEIQFEPFNQFFAYKHNVLGLANGYFQIHDLNQFLYEVQVDVKDLAFTAKLDSAIFKRIGIDTLQFGKGELRYNFSDGTYQIDRLVFNDGVSNFEMNGSLQKNGDSENTDQNFGVNANFSNVDLAKYNLFLEYYKRISGSVNGSFRLEGNRSNPIGKINLNSRNLNISELRFNGEFNSTISNGKWEIDETRIQINETKFDLSGWKKLKLDEASIGDVLLKDEFHYRIKSETDTISAISALNNEISQIIGRIKLDLNFDGTFEKPHLRSGTVSLKNTSINLQKLGNPLHDINYTGEIENGILKLENFNAKTTYDRGFLASKDDGYIYANGTVDLNNLLHPVINIDLQLDDFFANYYIENADVILNSDNLRVSGRDTLLIKGDLNVSDSEIYFDYENETKTRFQSNTELRDKYTIIDVNVVLGDNVRIYNIDPAGLKGFDLTLETAIGNPVNYFQDADESKQMRGVINVVDGSFTSFQTFEVETGTINLNDQDLRKLSFNPKVIFKGRYESEEYIFKVNFNEYLINLSNVKIDVYDINDENRNLNKTNEQVAFLLLFGQEDLENFEESLAFQTIIKSVANSNLNFITDFSVTGIGNSQSSDKEKANNDFSVRAKTKAIRLARGFKVKAVINSAKSSKLIEEIETSYRVSENLIIYVTSVEGNELTQSNTEREYNIRLQWYYEF